MSSVRPITHELWYGEYSSRLEEKIKGYLSTLKGNISKEGKDDVSGTIKGARILIGPHAGYTYSGKRLAETFKVWDTSTVKRVFILGPSHHVYFRKSVMVSKYHFYETPFGKLPVDVETTQSLVNGSKETFQYMSESVDNDEHSFEMHAPFVHYMTRDLPQGVPKIIPIMISGMDAQLHEAVVDSLQPYFENEENHFIISSDFCHWGTRFGYTEYLKPDSKGDLIEDRLVTLKSSSQISSNMPIYKSIKSLDSLAMQIATRGSYEEWSDYIRTTGNTICGQKPIGVVLRLIENYSSKHPRKSNVTFDWIGYSQSNKAVRYYDNSVSYASGYVKL